MAGNNNGSNGMVDLYGLQLRLEQADILRSIASEYGQPGEATYEILLIHMVDRIRKLGGFEKAVQHSLHSLLYD